MKQLKFLTTIFCEGKPVWYKNHIYQVLSEGVNGSGRAMYKLICEDLVPRGIDVCLSNKMYEVIEIEEEKKEEEKVVKKSKKSKKIKS